MTQRIDIALATYNGSAYLPEMLRSYEQQSHPDIRLIVSDDGSSDDTISFVNKHRSQISVQVVPSSPRKGVLRNFETAISATTSSYIALSDQDDVWHRDKLAALQKSIMEIEKEFGSDVPALVFSDLQIVDALGKVTHPSYFKSTLKSPATSFRDYVLSSHVPGCAMMINRALLEKALPFPEVGIHDHWLIQVATLMGKVGYVDAALMGYRQHGSNSVGLGSRSKHGLERFIWIASSIPRMVPQRLSRWRQQANSIKKNMTALISRYDGDIPNPEDRKLIMAIVDADRHGRLIKRFQGAVTGERSIDMRGILYFLERS